MSITHNDLNGYLKKGLSIRHYLVNAWDCIRIGWLLPLLFTVTVIIRCGMIT